MSNERFLIDTAFVQAVLNKRDQYHEKAKSFLPRVRAAAEVWITEAILVEIGNALSASNRPAAIQFIRQSAQTVNVRVVSVDTPLLDRATNLYQRRPDKTWGLTDCISFVVMQENGLTDAVTTDKHFVQAGFRALMLEE